MCVCVCLGQNLKEKKREGGNIGGLPKIRRLGTLCQLYSLQMTKRLIYTFNVNNYWKYKNLEYTLSQQ